MLGREAPEVPPKSLQLERFRFFPSSTFRKKLSLCLIVVCCFLMIVAKVTKIIGETDTDTGYATDVIIPASFVQKYTFLRPNLCLGKPSFVKKKIFCETTS